MGTIQVNNIKLYAFHGCLDEEAKIGSEYKVDVEVKADLKKSSKTDESKMAEELKLLTIAVTKLTEKFNNLDDRYPLRKELDTRHFKTAYRSND